MSQYLFELSQLNKSFGHHQVLKSVSLTIARGERVALVGPSGGGKSTLLKILSTQWDSQSEVFSILGHHLDKMTKTELQKLRTNISYIPQDLALVESLRVLQNVLLGQIGNQNLLQTLKLIGFPGKANTQRVFEILKSVGISNKLYHRCQWPVSYTHLTLPTTSRV